MHRMLTWVRDEETGARSIDTMIDVIDVRKAWKAIFGIARSNSGKRWHIGYLPEQGGLKNLENVEVLPVGNQMRIKYHTRRFNELTCQIDALRVERKKHAVEIAELGGPELL